MWISRKRYNTLMDDYERLREAHQKLALEYYDLKNKVSKMHFSKKEKVVNLKQEIIRQRLEDKERVECLYELLTDGKTKSRLCEEIGITNKTLERILNGQEVKPSTLTKIDVYLKRLL